MAFQKIDIMKVIQCSFLTKNPVTMTIHLLTQSPMDLI